MNRLLLVLLFLFSAPVFASEKPAHGEKPAEHGDKGKEEKKPEQEGLFASQDNLVPLPTIIAPVVSTSTGKLAAHLYIYMAALTTTAAEANDVKMRLPYVQDALLREAYRDQLTVDDPKAVPDTKALLAKLKDAANKAVGKTVITELQVGRMDTAPY